MALKIFIWAGPANDTAKLFIQQANGTFIKNRNLFFNRIKIYEDIGAEFFDADNDGDMDLIVASGGNQQPNGSFNLLTRIIYK